MTEWDQEIKIREEVRYVLKSGAFKVTYHEDMDVCYIWLGMSNPVGNYKCGGFEKAKIWAQGQISDLRVDLEYLANNFEGEDQ